MCGFIGRLQDSPHVRSLMEIVGIGDVFLDGGQFRPAFSEKSPPVPGLVIEGSVVEATWWYSCDHRDGKLIPRTRYTTFNARNLDNQTWAEPINQRRGLFIADSIGESIGAGKSKRQYLMEAQQGLILGALYKEYPDNLYSMAIITRPPHGRFQKYHDKAFPLFLPPDPEILTTWLSHDVDASDPVIADLLERPKLYPTLEVTQVKTFARGEALGATEILEAD